MVLEKNGYLSPPLAHWMVNTLRGYACTKLITSFQQTLFKLYDFEFNYNDNHTLIQLTRKKKAFYYVRAAFVMIRIPLRQYFVQFMEDVISFFI